MAKLRKIQSEPADENTLTEIEAVKEQYAEKLRRAKELLSRAVLMEPPKDVDELPQELHVQGFLLHPEFNQVFTLDPLASVNDKPVYWSYDRRIFMYRSDNWQICPKKDPEDVQVDLFEEARWGGRPGLAMEVKCDDGLWIEHDKDTGEWQKVAVQCKGVFQDMRAPMTPPEKPQVMEYVVDSGEFPNGEPPRNMDGVNFFRSKSLAAMEKRTIAWGTRIQGMDEGDDWLQVGDSYLPMRCRGRQSA
ncbi:unnamed protein product [Polarella glacialis]|uniref:Uncharacterized protein n=1 Tax=Polarella glacialis TaxID=89957 RepID=A0A813D9J2_POLGL|nr:unnamed protein product [Polarella glacialis]